MKSAWSCVTKSVLTVMLLSENLAKIYEIKSKLYSPINNKLEHDYKMQCGWYKFDKHTIITNLTRLSNHNSNT